MGRLFGSLADNNASMRRLDAPLNMRVRPAAAGARMTRGGWSAIDMERS